MKVLIVGCGSIGLKHLANLHDNIDAEIAIYDSDIKRSKEVLKKYPIRICSDIEDAIAWGVGAAIVATPNSSHVFYASQLLKYKIPCLIEKPISNNYEDAKKFIEKAKESQVPVFVACNMRYHRGPETLSLNLSKIGEPIFIDAHFSHYLPYMRPNVDYKSTYFSDPNEGGGVIFDCIHEIDYVTWLAGKVEQINSSFYSKLSDLSLDIEDYAIFSMSHKNKIVSHFRLDYIGKYKIRGCRIVGTKGNLIWESTDKTPEKCVVKYCHKDIGEEILYENDNLNVNQAYIDMLLDFIRSIKGEKREKLLTGEKALDVLSTALQVKNNF